MGNIRFAARPVCLNRASLSAAPLQTYSMQEKLDSTLRMLSMQMVQWFLMELETPMTI